MQRVTKLITSPTIDEVEGGKRVWRLPFNLGRIEGEEVEEQRFEDVRDKMSLTDWGLRGTEGHIAFQWGEE